MFSIDFCELLGNFLCTVWTGVVYYNDFPCKATNLLTKSANQEPCQVHVLLIEHFRQQPHNDGQILSLIVSRQYHGVLVRISGVVLALHVQRNQACKRVHERYVVLFMVFA